MKYTEFKLNSKSTAKRLWDFKDNNRFSCRNSVNVILLYFVTVININTISTTTQIITNVII